MARARFQHVQITAIDTTTGPVTRHIDEDAAMYSADPGQLGRLKTMVGVRTRHVAPPGITTLDLCEQSARRVLDGCGLDIGTVDALVFVTQTPDHWQPCNACLLHGRLGLPKTAAAFDINQGCSGWVYGLYVAAGMIEAGGCRRILLLAGDTVTQSIHPRDRSVVPLFGDAGTATLVEWTETPSPSWFALHSDGRGWQAIHIPAGGYRLPRNEATGVEVTDTDGSLRTAEHLHMNGLEVFNFTLREEPPAVRELLEFAGLGLPAIDFFIFHQANRFILENLAKRLAIPLEKVPREIVGKYGNQSSASVPATLCDALEDRLKRAPTRLLCSGFGVGLSWASCLLQMGPLSHCALRQFVPDALR
jgi:3-oxoacyl-[acyl-carrier-protein] synthase-3